MAHHKVPPLSMTVGSMSQMLIDPAGNPCTVLIEPEGGGDWALYFPADGTPKLFIRNEAGEDEAVEPSSMVPTFAPGTEIGMLPKPSQGVPVAGVVVATTRHAGGRVTYDVRVVTPDGRPGRTLTGIEAERIVAQPRDGYSRVRWGMVSLPRTQTIRTGPS